MTTNLIDFLALQPVLPTPSARPKISLLRLGSAFLAPVAAVGAVAAVAPNAIAAKSMVVTPEGQICDRSCKCLDLSDTTL